ncbi:MAG: Mth938-like domain-containing protein [Rhodocyclaceae bacterium]|nr:Mth938-like domain-containing protein [Rhodocyclaceae bacterium]
MKLQKTVTAGLNSVTAYGSGYVAVNGRILDKSFILTPGQLIEDWNVTSLGELSEGQVDHFKTLDCTIVLLGTGATQCFPDKKFLNAFLTRGIGIEVMDSFAACRTYNILMAEGRTVALALLMEPNT